MLVSEIIMIYVLILILKLHTFSIELCRGVKTAASMLFESVLEYGVSGGSGGLRNTRIT
jgi:hypothetical protein